MFGIGLPELIIIFAVALIVVGPDKLPGLARSLAKTFTEIKKGLEQAKESLTQEEELNAVKAELHKELQETGADFRKKLLEERPESWHPAAEPEREADLIEMEADREADRPPDSPPAPAAHPEPQGLPAGDTGESGTQSPETNKAGPGNA